MRHCWKSRCEALPPWLAVNPDWFGGALFACTDHVGQLAGLGFEVHRIMDVQDRPALADAMDAATHRHNPTRRQTP